MNDLEAGKIARIVSATVRELVGGETFLSKVARVSFDCGPDVSNDVPSGPGVLDNGGGGGHL